MLLLQGLLRSLVNQENSEKVAWLIPVRPLAITQGNRIVKTQVEQDERIISNC